MFRLPQRAEYAGTEDNGQFRRPSVIGVARLDQGPSNISNDDSYIGTMSHRQTTQASKASEQGEGSLYSFRSSQDFSQFVHENFGRTFNNLNDRYLLPTDETEWNRLDKQHVAFLAAMGGLYPCPEVIEPILAKDSTGSKAILDLGSGTGTWAIEMAKRFPHAAVTGVDIAPNPLDPATFPSNISFEIGDINHGLSRFHGQFDLIHMKLVRSGIADMRKTMEDIEHCLKPGGVVLIIDADPEFQDHRFVKIPMAKVGGDENVSGVSENGSWFARFHWEIIEAGKVAGTDLDKSSEIIDRGLWDHPLIDPETAVSGSVYLPIGPWAQSSDPVQTQLLKYVGVIMRQVCSNLHRTFHSALLRFGMTQEELDRWSQCTQEELDTLNLRYSVRFPFCWARRRAGPGQPAPPFPERESSPRTETITRFPSPFFETFQTAEEADIARRNRRESVGIFPSAAVKRAQTASSD